MAISSRVRRYLSPLFVIVLLLFSADLHAQMPAWQTNFRLQVFSPKVKTIVYEGKLFLKGLKARIEPSDAEEIDLYDFETQMEIRIFPKDGIYFRKSLSLAKQIKAAKEGWGPMPESFHEKKVLLRKGNFKGQAARLYFITIERQTQTAYMMRWVTDEAMPLPLRAIYSGSGRETIIVDFEPKKDANLRDEMFTPPSDYLSLNPF
ncbi:hypothetical protein MNBD_NITROSPIRAE01-944 [hydrothermal vent metagenome]|uniref:Outer membrane lipoprotein carrier protein LolA n=1 Tax=hydrothermal vent metagenome TaxID=652676 RepID=A0A3B1DD81_9ZZZZ